MVPMIEVLEDRRLLSVSVVPHTTHKPAKPTLTTTPSLVGDYVGTIKTKGVAFGIGSKTFSFEVDCDSQTIDPSGTSETFTGSVTFNGHSATGSITGFEKTNGTIQFKIKNTSITVTLSGSVNLKQQGTHAPGTKISGSGSANINGFSVSGSFSATEVSESEGDGDPS